jgi:hypothetical protein
MVGGEIIELELPGEEDNVVLVVDAVTSQPETVFV